MIIQRDMYLKKLISKMHDGRVKIITGIRRCGKSFLLRQIFKEYLLSIGTPEDHIIEIALDDDNFQKLRDPTALSGYVKARMTDSGEYYLFVDEIQMSYKVLAQGVDLKVIAEEDRDLAYITFYDVLNGLLSKPNLDIYVTGSNSRLLSKDVATNFRDRGVEIRMFPLSFAEYYPVSGYDKADAWEEYILWGGMPRAVLEPDENERSRYLTSLFDHVYNRDIVERYGVEEAYLESLIEVVFSSVGSLTNPGKLARTLNSVRHAGTDEKTVQQYLDELEDAFIIQKARRYDVKGKAYFDTPLKYYATDVGLRNAKLGFRQSEETHLMENIIFNELVVRGYNVDVGAVRYSEMRDGKKVDGQYEIDFVVNRGMKKVYIQSAFNIADEEKRKQEITPLIKSGDFFKKVVVTAGNGRPRVDDTGIHYTGVIPFLLDPNSLEK